MWRRSKKAEIPLPMTTLPWLVATASATVIPHFGNIPPWLAAGIGVAIAGRLWLWQRGRLTLPRSFTFLLVFAAAASVLFEYRTLFGREAGVALLAVFMSLKLFELRSSRDAIVIVMLGYFLLLTHYFYADELWVGLWMLFAMAVTTASLLRLQAPDFGSTTEVLRLSGLMIVQAMPIMLVLFLLFPRISGPLWGLPQDTRRATSGLSEEMSPGSISELTLSSATAFRVEFLSAAPTRDKLYWRGPVMTEYDGVTWRIARNLSPDERQRTPLISTRGRKIDYLLMLEPHNQRWLPMLEMPTGTPSDTWMTGAYSLLNQKPVRERMRYALSSDVDYGIGVTESPAMLKRSLALPEGINPRSRALAAEWRSRSESPRVIAAMALEKFRNESFVYTLQPPLLGKHGTDDFLFETRRGFCEHYAAAFVFLMRAADVPARIIGGYQGGEFNPVDNHLTIRQSDAHAWAEIWIAGEGWLRVDPTAAIAPGRIEQGLRAALPEGEPLPALMSANYEWLRTLRYRWDAVNYTWNLWVIGYNADRQRQVLKSLGLSDDWRTLTSLLSLCAGITLLAMTMWVMRSRRSRDPVQRLWQRLGAYFSRRGIPRQPWEGAQTFLKRVATDRPDLATLANRLAELYVPLRYGLAGEESLRELRRIVRGLPFRHGLR